MRYLSDDGETFATSQECIEHEGKLGEIASIMLEVEDFIDTLDKPDRSKAAYRRCIKEFLVWSASPKEEQQA